MAHYHCRQYGRTGYAGKLDIASSVTLLQHLHRGVSPAVTNGTINVNPTGYTDPSCSGYLGDVTWTVWLSNSAGSSPSVTVSDYWD